MNFDSAHLQALRAAVDEGSFDAAARVLSVTPSAVSQRIKALESETGRVLLRRSRPVAPTESGRAVLRLARQLEALTADVSDELGGDDTSGSLSPARLPLAVNADSLSTWLLPALAPLADSIVFELVREDESHTAELLRDGAVMAAVSATATPVQGCSSELLGAMRYQPLATPAFVSRWFGDSPRDFSQAPMVVFDRRDELQHRFLRTLPGGASLDPPRHYVPGSTDFVEAVRLGLGWGMIPDLQRPPEGLVELSRGAYIDVPLYWQQWQLRTRALDQAAAAIRAAAARALRPPVPLPARP
ncbi:LysR family transcriptional regulator ArgP [Herbiconiux flava]|uniref:LysR family transcriptional regulator (Chromosome initiation inhibitor) n=1 Tax=Herbiconiux flava TaxID=881268 RepID=A0A852SSP0_9MICO|nr:LysR family transcriptional regulator ArgP [Herbiconiux flava]NYD71936.1 LysR family transcriptional regulator (chromosome initiation inhibitor) [Herbiconiux flava]GLK18101.1 transcriptional regulator ArgP [Herbiconiux flava]